MLVTRGNGTFFDDPSVCICDKTFADKTHNCILVLHNVSSCGSSNGTYTWTIFGIRHIDVSALVRILPLNDALDRKIACNTDCSWGTCKWIVSVSREPIHEYLIDQFSYLPLSALSYTDSEKYCQYPGWIATTDLKQRSIDEENVLSIRCISLHK